MPVHSTEAIVIGGHDLGEADRIVVFYTRSSGKVRAVAEGARRIRTRFGGSLQLFTQGRLVYFERRARTLHKVNEFAVTRTHRFLREDLDRLALGATMVEAVALGVEEGEILPDLYHLLAEGLDLLEESPQPRQVLQGFALHLLRLLGYLPELSECVGCRQAVASADAVHLSPSQGGIVCVGCRERAADAVFLSAEAFGFLRCARGSTLRVIDRACLLPQALQEVSQTLQLFLHHVLGRPLRSAAFLSKL